MRHRNYIKETCKEKSQKLHMSIESCIENLTFLYMTKNEIKK